jgi:LEA14-like dessication related protein
LKAEKMLYTRVPSTLLKRLKIYNPNAEIPIKEIVAEVLDDRLKKLGF